MDRAGYPSESALEGGRALGLVRYIFYGGFGTSYGSEEKANSSSIRVKFNLLNHPVKDCPHSSHRIFLHFFAPGILPH